MSSTVDKPNPDLQKPFRSIHEQTGDLVKGFADMQSAEEDAKVRNERAKEIGTVARYKAIAKP